MLNLVTPNVFLPRPQRLYPWLRSYRKFLPSYADRAEEVLAEYGLKLLDRPVLASGGKRNISLVVTTSRGKGVLKEYQENLGSPTIIQEHSILKYLARINFPATRLVETKSGQTLVEQGQKRYALFDYVDGGFLSFDYVALPWQARQFIAIAGEMLAILHTKLADFTPQGYNRDGFKSKTGKRWRDIEWFVDKLEYSIQNTLLRNKKGNHNKYSALLQRANQLETILFENSSLLNDTDLFRQIIHKDYSPSHLLYRKNAPPVIIDFEIARLDWRLVDIVGGLKSFCASRKGNYSLKKIIIFLLAYQSHIPLFVSELKSIPNVWQLMQAWQCIFNWHQYSLTGNKIFTAKAVQAIKELDWVLANQNVILDKLGRQTNKGVR